MNLSRPWFLGLGAAPFVFVSVGCPEPSGARPNSVDPSHGAVSAPARTNEPPALEATPAAALPMASSSATAPDAGPASAATSASPVPETEPPLVDAQGKPLDQTDQRPTSESPAFQKRIAKVAQAILTGDVEPALSAFFPLVAYQQVKDVAKPERDYKYRLLANFKRDLLEYHHALGAAAAESKFDGITVSEKDAKWMAPGSEGNKLGYFRVLRSRLRFTLPTGRSREFELTSLISWRGEWYVVHLHGFK